MRDATPLVSSLRLRSLGDCLQAAEDLVNQASEEAAAATAEVNAAERAELEKALGFGSSGARPRNAQAALRDLEKQQSARLKRLQRDALDRVLTELTAYHRDVLAIQLALCVLRRRTLYEEPALLMLAGRLPSSDRRFAES
ncbi:DNA polymerase III delta prime subunit [Cutibacterium acnes JCM 18920]|nr:DNA polymerase III delta prime subunit [Cutibacterium acnes JCM 18920]